jgi:hypothetical protein
VSGPGRIAVETPQQCDECGGISELRPYGPGGRVVCFGCLGSHPEWEEEAEARAGVLLFGDPLPDKFERKD